MNEERERLIRELKEEFYFPPNGSSPSEIADYILADRERIVAPLVAIPSQDRLPFFEWISFATDGINATLKLSGVKI